MGPSPPMTSQRTQGKSRPQAAPSPGSGSGSGSRGEQQQQQSPPSHRRKQQRMPATDAPISAERVEAKRLFLEKLDESAQNAGSAYKLLSREEHASAMHLLDGLEHMDKDARKDHIAECKNSYSWTASKVSRLVMKYDVLRNKSPTDGKTYVDLVERKGNTVVPHQGSIYEAIEREHLAQGHVKAKGLYHAVKARYGGGVPRWMCELFSQYCPTCIIKMPVKPKVCVVCTCIHALLRLLDCLSSLACLHACSGGRAHTHHLGRLGSTRPV